MLKSGLPLPGTTTEHGGVWASANRWGLSKRASKLTLCAALVLVTLGLYSYSFSTSHSRVDIAELERILEDHASSVVIGGGTESNNEGPSVYEGEGLTSLGLEADESFHLGSTILGEYRLELEEFVMKSFPTNYQKDAMASLYRHLDESGSQTSFSPIPHKIWQTAKLRDPDSFQNWKHQVGFEYTFMNDADADKWMKERFEGSLIWWTWKHLPTGILRSDYLRYVLMCFEGGIYTDTDTSILKSFNHWGAHPDEHNASPGPASLIVGIEADVGTRSDWHQWWPRPLQICQWTIASAPFQPAMIDVLRRVYNRCLELEEWKQNQGLSDAEGDERIRQAIKNDELVGSIMEWTGPGVFTDTVLRYLIAAFGVQWPDLKDRRIPARYREAVILPVTGFAPGIGMFNAGETTDPQALVHHYFSGSWKHS